MGTDLRDRDRQTWLRLYVCLLSLGWQPAHQLSECQLPWIRNRSLPTSWSPSSPPLTLPLSVLWGPTLCRHSPRSTQWDPSNSLALKATPTTMDPMATRSLPLPQPLRAATLWGVRLVASPCCMVWLASRRGPTTRLVQPTSTLETQAASSLYLCPPASPPMPRCRSRSSSRLCFHPSLPAWRLPSRLPLPTCSHPAASPQAASPLTPPHPHSFQTSSPLSAPPTRQLMQARCLDSRFPLLPLPPPPAMSSSLPWWPRSFRPSLPLSMRLWQLLLPHRPRLHRPRASTLDPRLARLHLIPALSPARHPLAPTPNPPRLPLLRVASPVRLPWTAPRLSKL